MNGIFRPSILHIFFAKDVYLAGNFQIAYLQKILEKAKKIVKFFLKTKKKIAKSLDNGGGGGGVPYNKNVAKLGRFVKKNDL